MLVQSIVTDTEDSTGQCFKLKIQLPFQEEDDEVHYTLQALARVAPNIVVAGIPSVKRVVIENTSIKDEEGELKKGYKLVVEGYGFNEAMAVDGVIFAKSRPNHIMDIHKVLGIEAARTAIVDEILIVMGSHGISIDERHVALLADLMTFKGMVLGITRNGIAKMRDSVLMLASFEKTTDHLFEASFFGKKDPICGVSEAIILGNPMGIGSGLIRLLQKVEDQPLPPIKKLVFDRPEFHESSTSNFVSVSS